MPQWVKNNLVVQLNRIKKEGWLSFYEEAAERYELDMSDILAISSRETNARNIVGDAGHGRGINQIDDRYHAEWIKNHEGGLDPKSNILYASGILRANLNYFRGDRQRAFAAYNCGISNVNKAVKLSGDPDRLTTGKDYGRDCIARATVFKALLEKGKQGGT